MSMTCSKCISPRGPLELVDAKLLSSVGARDYVTFLGEYILIKAKRKYAKNNIKEGGSDVGV